MRDALPRSTKGIERSCGGARLVLRTLIADLRAEAMTRVQEKHKARWVNPKSHHRRSEGLD